MDDNREYTTYIVKGRCGGDDFVKAVCENKAPLEWHLYYTLTDGFTRALLHFKAPVSVNMIADWLTGLAHDIKFFNNLESRHIKKIARSGAQLYCSQNIVNWLSEYLANTPIIYDPYYELYPPEGLDSEVLKELIYVEQQFRLSRHTPPKVYHGEYSGGKKSMSGDIVARIGQTLIMAGTTALFELI